MTTESERNMIVTDKAIAEVKKIVAEQSMDMSKVYLRVAVKGQGCSGFGYVLNLDEEYNEQKDFIEELPEGIKLVIDKRSAMYLDGVTLDFHESIDKRGFKFDNPQATGHCGCGKSFSM